MKTRFDKALAIFYILSSYVLLQFGWWTYQLIRLNREIIFLTPTPNNIKPKELFLDKILMVAGEGAVFLILILLGASYILRSFKREIQLARRQQNFLLSITHELKTPISTIKLYLQTLLKRELNPVKKEEAINTMLQENERLNALVEKMLLAAKIDDSNFTLNQEKINLSKIIRNLAQKKWTKKVHLSLNITEKVFITIDTEAIDTILSNLLDNAIKYGASEIKINLTQEKEHVFITLADNGIGISDNEKEKVFERFYRIGNENTRKTKGTGLGLYIVKTLIEMHRGMIKISNNSPKGSIFEIKFKTT